MIREQPEIFIRGAGGQGRVCAEIAEACGWRVAGFVDIKKYADELVNGHPIVAPDLTALAGITAGRPAHVVIALGDNMLRCAELATAARLGFGTPVLVHPSSVISPSSRLGVGCVVMPGGIVNANATLGAACIVNTGATLDHDDCLGDGVQICPGVHAAGRVTIGARAFVGTGASIIPGINIGAGAVIAAGSVVIRDVPEGERVAGVPARILRDRSQDRAQ